MQMARPRMTSAPMRIGTAIMVGDMCCVGSEGGDGVAVVDVLMVPGEEERMVGSAVVEEVDVGVSVACDVVFVFIGVGAVDEGTVRW